MISALWAQYNSKRAREIGAPEIRLGSCLIQQLIGKRQRRIVSLFVYFFLFDSLLQKGKEEEGKAPVLLILQVLLCCQRKP
jgi:hypothetical protein